MAIISGGSGGGGSGAMTRLGTQTLAAPAANITISGIPGTSTHLYVVYQIRSAVASESAAFGRIQLNSDTGTNYGRENVNGTGTSVSASGGSGSQTFIDVVYESGPSATANMFGAGALLIPYYANTSKIKVLIGNGGILPVVNTTTGYIAGAVSGFWNSTSAVTSIAFLASDGSSNLATGSTVTVYGIT